MKTFFQAGGTAVAVLSAYLGISYFWSEPDYVTAERFEAAHKEVISMIDSVDMKVDSALTILGVVDGKVDVIDAKITNMESNIDSLKYGQRIIYNQVNKGKKSYESQFPIFKRLFN